MDMVLHLDHTPETEREIEYPVRNLKFKNMKRREIKLFKKPENRRIFGPLISRSTPWLFLAVKGFKVFLFF